MTALRQWLSRQIAEGDRIPSVWALWLPLLVAIVLAVFGKLWPADYAIWMGSEDRGLLELSHGVIPLCAFLIGLRSLFLPALRGRPLLFAWILLATLGSLYIAGEETSWGQHYLGWATPEGWDRLNDQGETNLHNTSSWFDQKPRAILEIGVILGGLILPWLLVWKPALKGRALAIVVPPLSCFPAALLAEFSAVSQRSVNWLGGESYLFHRTSEVQELYFYYFILLYLIVMRRRIAVLERLRHDEGHPSPAKPRP